MFKATITNLVLACLFMAAPAQAMEEIASGWLDNKAVGGYDTVAYHTQDEAVNGKDAFRSVWKATAWYFASEENLNAFEATPEKYAPQYGGYCAWNMAQGKLLQGAPTVWHIEDGKLYLYADQAAKDKWMLKRKGLIAVADRKFPELVVKWKPIER